MSLVVVLDLDETLVHLNLDGLDYKGEWTEVDLGIVHLRPGLREFLELAREKLHLVLFTASTQGYADSVLQVIDPKGEIFKGRYYRHNCLFHNGYFRKDLTEIGTPIERTVLVDNSEYPSILQPLNWIPIEDFRDNHEDKEMERLKSVLLDMSTREDVRIQV